MQTQHNFVSVVNESPISQTIEVEKNHTPEYNDLLKDFCGERPTVINETREKCCKCKAIHLIMVCLLKKKKKNARKKDAEKFHQIEFFSSGFIHCFLNGFNKYFGVAKRNFKLLQFQVAVFAISHIAAGHFRTWNHSSLIGLR